MAVCAASLLIAPAARAIISFSGPITTTGGDIEITESFDVTITTGGSIQVVVLDDWVTSDGSNSGLTVSPSSLSYRINGGAVQSVSIDSVWDNLGNPNNDVAPNDGYFLLTFPLPVLLNDVITFEVQSWSTGSNIDWNPEAIQAFNGNAFVADSGGNALSALTPVPEPSAYAALAGIVALGLAVCRRRVINFGKK